MPKLMHSICNLVLLSGTAALAQVAVENGSGDTAVSAARANVGPTTRPASDQASAEENPFIIADVPASNRPRIAASSVVRFRLVDGFLVAETSLPPSAPQLQKVEGLNNAVHLAVTHRSGNTAEGGGYYSPDMLQVTYVSNEGARWMRTSLFTAINHLNLSRDSITNGSEHTIQFIQSAQPAMAGKAASLYIQSLNPDAIDQKQSYSAEHFAAFIRKYPAETTQYLRPMVEVLGPQPQLFAVDDSLACSVFPEAFTTNEARRAEIMALVNELNADDFRKRQDATQKLEQLGVAAAAVLATLDRGSMPPEQAARVDAIISRIKPPYDIDAKQLRTEPGFLLDCLLSPDVTLQKAALAQLKKVNGQEVAFDPGADDAARVKAVYELRSKLLVTGPPTTQPATTH